MKKIFLCLVFVLNFSAASELKSITGFQNPSGIFADKNEIFVSNIGEKTNFLMKDKGGFISRLDKDGNLLEQKFISGLDKPTNLMRLDNTLFVLDTDKIKAFDMQNKAQIYELLIGRDLNGIEILNENALLTSDRANSTIYKIDLQTRICEEFLKLDTNKFGTLKNFALNSLKNTLYILSEDENKQTLIMAYELSNQNLKIFKKDNANYEFIALYENLALLSTNDKIYSLNLRNKKIEALKFEKLGNIKAMFLQDEILWLSILSEAKVLRIALKN